MAEKVTAKLRKTKAQKAEEKWCRVGNVVIIPDVYAKVCCS